jgi:membrane protease YdiL (CAAX protease family)
VVSLVFAAIHPQGWVAIPVLGSIALILAALREYRGSLIAPMTAHALNNALAVLMMVLMMGQ